MLKFHIITGLIYGAMGFGALLLIWHATGIM